jgi:hypothetical protein
MPAASLYEVVLAIHIMAVVVAFGVTFAYPILFTVIVRSNPREAPLLHRIEYTVERLLVNPGLLLVILAGIYLASEGHHWSEFFVQWGLAVAIVIGGLVGGVTIPASKRAERLAARDLGAGAEGETIEMSAEYLAVVRRLWTVGGLMSTLVLLTILFMVIKP